MIFPYQLIDLTHRLSESSPSWSGSCGFRCESKLNYEDCTTEVKFSVQQFKMHAGIGTHMDAPRHCVPEGRSVDELSLDELVLPCRLIDVSLHADAAYLVGVQDLLAFEAAHGVIPVGSFVMFKTGWGRFWDDAKQYRNDHCFPSIAKEAADFLLDRGVKGIGIDTLSPDCPPSGFPVHQAFLGADKYIVENAANLDALRPVGDFIMVMPMKIKDAAEAAVRLFALRAV